MVAQTYMGLFFSHMKKTGREALKGYHQRPKLQSLFLIYHTQYWGLPLRLATSCFKITAGIPVIMTTIPGSWQEEKCQGKRTDAFEGRHFPETFSLYFIGLGEEILLVLLFSPAGHIAQEEGKNGYWVSNSQSLLSQKW